MTKFSFKSANFVIKENEKPSIELKGDSIYIEIMKPSIMITLNLQTKTYEYMEIGG